MRNTLQEMLDGIPYVRSHGLVIEHVGPQVRVRMPDDPGNANIAGGLHASALYCAAETAAGVAAWCIRSDPAIIVLVRDVQIRYPRRATGEVHATATVTSVAGTDATVEAKVTDEDGLAVLEATFSYAMRSANGSSGTPSA
ncbi:MAG: DUF4442 domain-containing protein [Candidatus Nanopelagicales bacterium]|nr:DUF4442 domain-containing protein [Candidatus Nanopelagicales bacterium]MDZ4249969.1 DUF4442 domain-containing protein [Candidatus Nanopelagicales bacterium]